MSEQAPTSDRSIKTLFPQLSADDILKVLRQRLEHERITKHVEVVSGYEHALGNTLITPQTSLMLSFLSSQKPEHKDRDTHRVVAYRLLMILNLREEEAFPDELRLALTDLKGQFSLDRIIIWTVKQVPKQITRVLKNQLVETVFFNEREIGLQTTFPFFLPLYNKPHEYDVAVNAVACLLTTRLKKLFHLVLSEIAAPVYDELYGKDRVATNEVMQWEDDEVKKLAQQLAAAEWNELAIDVGCGTGRHTFPLAEHFSEVYAFDFSPRMIEQARTRKKQANDTKIQFDTIDIEYEEVPPERVKTSDGHGRVDLIVASFGMASFVEDTSLFLKTLNSWLKPGGYAILSFYNSDALLLNVTPNWRDTSLSAHLDSDNRTLKVELDPETIFYLFCQPYSQELLRSIKGVFKLEGVSTFPSLMALMPNSLLSDARAREVFSRADRVLGSQAEIAMILNRLESIHSSEPGAQAHVRRLKEILQPSKPTNAGYYVLVTVRKEGDERAAHERVLGVLREKKCKYEVINHGAVHSVSDVVRAIGRFPRRMVKTVLLGSMPLT